uniref:BTB domain-containing protein n=1 Tax=Culex tarsalis TaxID=7177 RepID=A0A1Q3F7Q0_CULTA
MQNADDGGYEHEDDDDNGQDTPQHSPDSEDAVPVLRPAGLDATRHNESNRISTDSASTYEIVDCHSPESTDEMWSNVVKITRDNSAMVSALVDGAVGGGQLDEEYEIQDGGGESHRGRYELARSASTKEEKQRQNQEILVMKSNSVSSENNSWETFSPSKPVTDDAVEIPAMLQSKPGTSKACFIDASSLYDEDEVPYPSFVDANLQRQQQEKTSISLSAILSDDEKLKSTANGQLSLSSEVKDQYSSMPDSDFLATKLIIKEKEIDTSEEAAARQEAERKQGTFLFQNSIQQYSGHVIDPSVQFPDENYSDMSLPSVYSSSSEPNYEYSSFQLDNPPRFITTGGINTSGYNSGSADYSARLSNATETDPAHYPDTPFNSIVHVNSAAHIPIAHRYLPGDSRESSVDRESHSTPIKIPKRVQKHDESAPIVSGGASIEDFTPKQCESPQVRRRTDTCPIVSGGMSFEDDFKPEERSRKHSSSSKSWVVELKNCPDDEKSAAMSSIEHNRSGLGFFVDLGSLKTPEEQKSIVVNNRAQNRTHQDLMKKSTGFYIDLSDGEGSRSNTPKLTKPSTPPVKTLSSESSRSESVEKDAKKNMFSMFIDFGSESSPKASSAPRKATAQVVQNKEEDESATPQVVPTRPANLNADEKKNCYMFIESEASPIMRRSNGSSVGKNESKRHSWNPSSTEGTFHERRIMNREYQRSTSVTSDKGIMNILDKIPLLSKTSSMSIDSSVSPYEDFTCSKSELSTYSNHSGSSNSARSSNESKVSPKDAALPDGMTASTRKKRRDVKINETFDKSSQGSVTDGILSSNEDTSPVSTTTDTDDVTFQNNPADEPNELPPVVEQAVPSQEVKPPLASNGKQMETIVEAVENSPKHVLNGSSRKSQHTMETLHATIEKQKQLLETVSENQEAQSLSSFVKLSDMDKPPAPSSKFELHSYTGSGSGSSAGPMSSSAGSNRVARLFGDSHKYNTIGSTQQTQHQQQQHQHGYYGSNGTASMERHSWNMSRSTGNNFMNLVSSVENSRSLSRLFPHLSKAFSNSLPSDVGMNSVSKGSELHDLMTSDFSCTSSITSSRSGIESIDESISSRQPRRLGEDLLKMFLQEIATDVAIEAESKKMRAHKCILRSRCQYFAAILAGGWVQNAGNVISLPGYSYAAVHFALCHIYSGASHPPEGISLMELAALSDLLGLEGLKEVTAYALKTNYCHNFHKPCSGCTDGVLQVLPVTLNHGLDDLYRKCLKWVCRHYVKIWSNKQFSQLPPDVINRCKQQIVAHLTSETVLNTILDSEQLLTVLHPYKWSVEVDNVVRDILDAAYDYIQDHFASLLASDSFLSLGHNYSWAISHVEPILLRAATSLSPDQACKSYPRATRLHKLLQAKVLTMTATPLSSSDNLNIMNIYEKKTKLDIEYSREEEEMDWCDEFVGMVNAILSAVEQLLIRQCARAMRVNSWQRMDIELRNKIQKLACLMEPTEERKSRSRYSYSSQTSSSSSIHSRTNDLRQVRLAIQAHTKRSFENQNNHNVNNKTQTQHTQTVVHHNDLNSALNTHKVVKLHDNSERSNIRMEQQYVENGRLSKTASKTQVVESNRPMKANVKVGLLSKNNLGSHKRSQSEDMGSKVAKAEPLNNLKTKLSNVKPRYLEPKKPKNTGSNLQVQTISSSGSSTRTSSPATSRKKGVLANTVKHGHDSNISLDSLSSPAKNAKNLKTRPTINEMDVSIDSLADSLKSSSIKTNSNTTLSHESLIYQEYFKLKDTNLEKPQNAYSKSNPLIYKDRPNAPKSIDSLAANKTSSSSSSAMTRNNLKPSGPSSSKLGPPKPATGINRTASTASVGSNSSSSFIKKSFLSQRSREILARRSHETKSNSTNSSNKSAASSPSLISRDKSTASDITKSGSSASLASTNSGPRKVFNTTLHLRRTAKLEASPKPTVDVPKPVRHSSIPVAGGGNGHQSALRKSSSVNRSNSNGSAHGAGRAAKSTVMIPVSVVPAPSAHANQQGDYGITTSSTTSSSDNSSAGGKPPRVESKLERSNTFCKETSDNPVVLQIIE